MEVTKGTEIDVKRLYLNGVVFEEPCPQCGLKHREDLSQNYLSYPSVGVKEPLFFYCEDCDMEYSIDVILNISVDRV